MLETPVITSKAVTTNKDKPVIFARRIADALERHLMKADTSVHWVVATGDEPSYRAPTAVWPEGDLAFRICVFEGVNEGSRIEVLHEANEAPFNYISLLRVKTLSGIKRAFPEAVHVHDFLNDLNPELYREALSENHPQKDSKINHHK